MLSERGQLICSARIAGRLYDFGRYPGAVKSDQAEDWLHGELYRLDDLELLPVLDEYEGPEFIRATAPAKQRIEAQSNAGFTGMSEMLRAA